MSTAPVMDSRERRLAWGRQLAAVRSRAGLTQEGLSTLAGLPKNYVNRIEQGARLMGVANLFRLADALGVNAEELRPPCGTL